MHSSQLGLLCFIILTHWAASLPPKNEVAEDYKEVLRLSLLFYKAQRSGYLPDRDIPWRENSALEDKGQNGEDLTGGYYDGKNYFILIFICLKIIFIVASDFVKFSYTMAFTTTILSWGAISYEDAYKKAGKKICMLILYPFTFANHPHNTFCDVFLTHSSGQHEQVLDAIKWATDYFVKCHVSKYELYGQVGDFAIDHKFWGRPEDLNMTRPAYKIDKNQPGAQINV